MRSKKNTNITGLIIGIILITIGLVSLNFIKLEEPQKPTVAPFEVFVDRTKVEEKDEVIFNDIGETKTFEVLVFKKNFEYGGRLEIEHNLGSAFTVKDISEETHNTVIEITLMQKEFNDFYFKFIDFSENYIMTFYFGMKYTSLTNITFDDITFY